MHSQSTSVGVQNVLNTRHVALYGNALDSYYKSDLLSLTGTLDFSANASSIGTVYTADGNNSLLKYLPNIKSLIFDNCTSLIGSSLESLASG